MIKSKNRQKKLFNRCEEKQTLYMVIG